MRSLIPVILLVVIGWCELTSAQGSLDGDQRRDPQRWLRTRPLISDIQVTGNQAIGDGKIRDWMELTTAGFWARFGLASRPHLNLATLRRDENTIAWQYSRLGYWDATAAIDAEPARDEDHANITVTINEGQRYYWGLISLVGDTVAFPGRLQKIMTRLESRKPADSIEFVLVQNGLLGECANNGYPGARLNAALSVRADTIDVVFTLRRGPYVTIGGIQIEGLSHTKPRIVHRVLRVERGTEYSHKRIEERRQDVYATGLFSLVRLDPSFSDSTDTSGTRSADLLVRLIERPPSFFGFRTGAGQDADRDLTWDYAVDWGSRNWLGTARRYTLTAQSNFVVVTEWRVLHHRFSAQYVEPFPFGLRFPTTLELSYEPPLRAANQDYRIETMSGELSVSRRNRAARLQWVTSLAIDRVNVTDVPVEAVEDILEEEGISVRRRLAFALERDTRPNLFVPTSGARTRLDLGFIGGPLGGGDDFYSADFSWSKYQVVSSASVFASRIRFGWKNLHSGGSSIPTDERFYLGGANSIRGYAEDGVGPTDSSGSAIGGRAVTLVNLELRTPMRGNWWFTLFGDAGNNWSRFREIRFDRMLFSLGVGLQYVAPVGPIRLDYARRVIHPNHPPSDRLHLSILFSF